MIELKTLLGSAVVHKTIFSKTRITIGRSEDNDLVLANPHVSRLEAIIEKKGDGHTLFDKSRNGVLVDNHRVEGEMLLPSVCRITIYPFEIQLANVGDDETMTIPSPLHPETIKKPGENRSQTDRALTAHFSGLIGESPPMLKLYQLIQNVGNSRATILIRGEHGTGKELVARAIHEVSSRNQQVYIPVNCAAIPIDLIESELFGYEKGAFTSAQHTKKGKIEEAAGGTIFLDEIGELSLSAQAKVLRFLQNKTIMRIGSAKEFPIDVRIVAATNRDLEQAIKQKEFRPDLYFRLRVVQVELPPLRERKDDIPQLVTHFIQKLSTDMDLPQQPLIADEALELLTSAAWPGNVRQLENTIYSAMIRAPQAPIIEKATLLEDMASWITPETESDEAPLETLGKQALLQVLTQHQWDTTKAAEVLKVSRGTIYYKMKKYGIEAPHGLRRSQ
ncbi:MAG: sigma 54-dependent Fis family transcriptional regulator [Nitrospirota bacterium]|nr:sigma 54-dependent Fis family transcriptional regulator [Nitrospirota bacterium]MDH5774114.1 sigma 54-dependent Fis family transcriptional regulator [Nitrospirota bacterium]